MDIFEEVLDTMERVISSELFTNQKRRNGRSHKIKVMFHGGEPLVAGHNFWRQALPAIRRRFPGSILEFSLQSNLWMLDDEYCQLFANHDVNLGTSLDGPEDINDTQRGAGYFAKTMKGIHLARSYGFDVGCIATFTSASFPHWGRVFEFFLSERLKFSIHPAVSSLGNGRSAYALSAREYSSLLLDMLNAYVKHRREIHISSLSQICQGVAAFEGTVCTFRDCLSIFLAFDPLGGIYPCQRFCGNPVWALGWVQNRPSYEQLFSSPTAKRFSERQSSMRQECGDCPHFEYCKGGCPYNAWADNRSDGGSLRDPYCDAYRRTFDYIQARLLEEMNTEENIEAVAAKPWDGQNHPLFRKGPLTELSRKGPHPSRIAGTARLIVAAVELARAHTITAAASQLVKKGICNTQQSAETSLAALQDRLHPRISPLNNLYLHITLNCQLHCTHCYACSGEKAANEPSFGSSPREIPVSALRGLIHEAWEAGFRQVVITGGEPLVHSHCREMLEILAKERVYLATTERPASDEDRNSGFRRTRMNLVLRTNFAMPLTPNDMRRIAVAFDQVVVSVDGNEETHDARRGKGSYAATLHNLDRYAEMVSNPGSEIRESGELSLACVMHTSDIQGEPGRSVHELADRLGIHRIRFRPILPLGRASRWDEPPASEALGSHVEPMDLIQGGFFPVSNCGLGQNLYVEPGGESFPCYALHHPNSYLGNVISQGLQKVLDSAGFRDLARHTVDSNTKCRLCEVRYLCGGACRAWSAKATHQDLDDSPKECQELRRRAYSILDKAEEFLYSR